MRKLLNIFGVLFFMNTGNCVFAQEWQLFPLAQQSFYEITIPEVEPFTETVFADSLRTSADTIWYYYNTQDFKNNCYTKKEILNELWSINKSFLKVDSSYILNHATFFGCQENDSIQYFKFIKNLNLSESYLNSASNVKITYDSILEREVYGTLDSLKYFNVQKRVNNQFVAASHIILSKTFGLIEFIPFCELLNLENEEVTQVKMIGFKKNGLKYGLVTPDFEDFFHLSTGDVLYWFERFESSFPNPVVDTYYKDSIINSTKTPDSVIYEIRRFKNNVWGSPWIARYYKKGYAKILTINTYSGFFIDNFPKNEIPYNSGKSYWQTGNYLLSDTLSKLYFHSGELVLDTSACQFNHIFDQYISKGLDTRYGLSSSSFGGTSNSIIAGIISGKQYGVIPMLTKDIKNIPLNIKIHPNPSTNKFVIDFPEKEKCNYKIIDITGRIVDSGSLNSNYVDIDHLKQGIYNLLIFRNEVSFSKRVVKVE